MGFYTTILVSFGIGITIILLSTRFIDTREVSLLKRSVFILLGLFFVLLITWYVVQLLFSLPPISSALDVPAVVLGLLSALGLSNALAAIKARTAQRNAKR